MATITVSIDIAATVDEVWRHASDLPTHAEWMADAESIEFRTEQRSGVGTQMEVFTRVGPLHTTDLMEVTEWIDRKTIGVRHEGLVTGEGRFTLEATTAGTRFTWSEQLSFPWYLGGAIVAQLARPVLRWIWRRNLESLRSRIES